MGKEEAFLSLSRHYGVKVAVTPTRLAYIQAMDIDWQPHLTTDPQSTWIEVIPKAHRENRIAATRGSVAMSLTGWTNLKHAYPEGFRSYLIPYSLHSTFREMEQLVSWVRPGSLRAVVAEGG